MNRTRLLMIGVLAVMLGLFAAMYVYRGLQSRSGNVEAGTQVMVAADDLQVGVKVEEHDIKIITIPASALPPGAPRKRADVVGHGVILPISTGEFILASKLANENAGDSLPSLIPPGMRAVSVRVNEVVSVAGFVRPGTRVDVLLTGTPGGNSEQQTTTVLQNVAVLASGTHLERTPSGEPQNTPVITLLVSPDDAQKVTLAQSEGHIQLSLRNPVDTRAEDVPSSSARGLYKGLAAIAPPVTHAAVHRAPVEKAAPVAPTPTGVSIEVYEGDKKPEVVKCSEENCSATK